MTARAMARDEAEFDRQYFDFSHWDAFLIKNISAEARAAEKSRDISPAESVKMAESAPRIVKSQQRPVKVQSRPVDAAMVGNAEETKKMSELIEKAYAKCTTIEAKQRFREEIAKQEKSASGVNTRQSGHSKTKYYHLIQNAICDEVERKAAELIPTSKRSRRHDTMMLISKRMQKTKAGWQQ